MQTFSSDAVDELQSVIRNGTLTVAGSVTGAIAHLAVNGKPAELYSDGSFASADGFDLSTNRMFITLATNSAGTLVGSHQRESNAELSCQRKAFVEHWRWNCE